MMNVTAEAKLENCQESDRFITLSDIKRNLVHTG